MGDILSGEIKNIAKCEHRICPVKHLWASPNPYYKQKERTNRFYSRNVLSFFVGIK